jgi:hypothetical protein
MLRIYSQVEQYKGQHSCQQVRHSKRIEKSPRVQFAYKRRADSSGREDKLYGYRIEGRQGKVVEPSQPFGRFEMASRCCHLPYAHDRKNGKETSEPDEEVIVDNEHIHAQRIPVNEKVIYKNTLNQHYH